MIQPKNIQFTHLIKAGGRLREFNFHKRQEKNESLFTVDVASESGDRQYIFFRLKDDQWILQNSQIIPWIIEVMPQIENVINAYK